MSQANFKPHQNKTSSKIAEAGRGLSGELQECTLKILHNPVAGEGFHKSKKDAGDELCLRTDA